MKATGVENPIGAIMTYNKIAIVTLEDYSSDEHPDHQGHTSRVQAAQKDLTSGCSPRSTAKPAKESCKDRGESPVKRSFPFGEENKKHDDMMKEELTDEEVPRSAYFSRVHKGGEVMPCLLQAVEIAFKSVKDMEEAKIPCLKNGEEVGKRLAFKLGEYSMTWTKISSENVLAINNGELPPIQSTYFFILGKLGDGGVASVYLACNTSARVCAIKDYSLKPSSAADHEARQEDENKERSRLYSVAEKEAKLWKHIYKGRFDARIQYLGGKPCLLMPYGHDIGEASKRLKYVRDVRDELRQFAKKGYMYKESDMRWRHVLLDTDKKPFLCDLESLEEIVGTLDAEEAVYKQLLVLLKEVVTKDEDAKTLEWIQEDLENVVLLTRTDASLTAFFAELNAIQGEVSEVVKESEIREIIKSLFCGKTNLTQLEDDAKARVALSMIHRKATLPCLVWLNLPVLGGSGRGVKTLTN